MSAHKVTARRSIDGMTRKDLCRYLNTSSQVYSVPATEMRHVQILRWEKSDWGTISWQPKAKAAYMPRSNPSEKEPLHRGKPGWIPKLWPRMTPPVREAAVNATIFLWLVAAGPGPECQGARNQGPTGRSGREDFVGSWMFVDDVPAVGSAATAPGGGTGGLPGLSWARA